MPLQAHNSNRLHPAQDSHNSCSQMKWFILVQNTPTLADFNMLYQAS